MIVHLLSIKIPDVRFSTVTVHGAEELSRKLTPPRFGQLGRYTVQCTVYSSWEYLIRLNSSEFKNIASVLKMKLFRFLDT